MATSNPQTTTNLLLTVSNPLGMTSFPAFPIKQDRENYFLWSNSVQSALEAFELDGFITGATTPPPAEIKSGVDGQSPEKFKTCPNPEYLLWKKKDKLVLLWLMSTMTERILTSVTRASTSREAWVTLQRIFQSQSRARVMQMRWRLQSMEKGSLSILEYVEQKRSMADNLASIANPVSEDDLVNYILHRLGEDYSSFHTSINTRAEPILVDELLGMLLQEEEKLEHSKKVLMSANVATQKSRNNNYGKTTSYYTNKPKPHNFRGNISGSNQSGTNKHSFNKPKVSCQICSKPGHTALACYNRFNHSYTPEKPAKLSALIASPNTPSDPSWYVDSGATNHLTADLNNLSMHSEFNGDDQIEVGNGMGLTISHVGHSQLKGTGDSLLLKNILRVPKITKNLLSVSKFTRDNNVSMEFYP